jgi:voltage-gated potassium channel
MPPANYTTFIPRTDGIEHRPAGVLMPFLLGRLLRRFAATTWALPVTLATTVFLTSWSLMTAAEPESDIAAPENFWWWFIVTGTTVGYGDLYPQTTAGRLVGGLVIVGGVATLTTLFARLATAIDNAKGRRMNGTATVNATGHIVVIGYTTDRTDQILTEVIHDRGGRTVALCAPSSVVVHPVAHLNVAFVRGGLSDEETLRRAGVHRAAHVLIDADTDDEALSILVTVAHLTSTAHVIAALHDLQRVRQMSMVHSKVQCVQWHHPRMLAEELQDPGISRIYTELMTHGGGNTYSLTLPPDFDEMTAGAYQVLLGQGYGATLLAFDHDGKLHVSPPWHQPIPSGATLFYIARRRLTLSQLREPAIAALR